METLETRDNCEEPPLSRYVSSPAVTPNKLRTDFSVAVCKKLRKEISKHDTTPNVFQYIYTPRKLYFCLKLCKLMSCFPSLEKIAEFAASIYAPVH